jgi:hypothetical protein
MWRFLPPPHPCCRANNGAQAGPRHCHFQNAHLHTSLVKRQVVKFPLCFYFNLSVGSKVVSTKACSLSHSWKMSSEINAIAIIFSLQKYCLSITHTVLGAIVCYVHHFKTLIKKFSLSTFWEELGLCYTPILQEFIVEGVGWWVGGLVVHKCSKTCCYFHTIL